MQRLTRGSVICFGTTIGGAFCLDTVLVVATNEPWIPAAASDLEVDEAFRTCTADSVAANERDKHIELTLYRGATINEPVEGMFSFVPALPISAADPRFMRPAIESRFIKPSNRQSTWGSKRPLAVSEVRTLWQEVHDQVLAADLVLGVQLRTPELVSGDVTDDERLSRSEAARC